MVDWTILSPKYPTAMVDGTEGLSRGFARGLAGWLCLAATPTFAIMALLTAVHGGTPDGLCSAAHGASPLSGMVPMYLLMSAFHSAPWLKLISGRQERRGNRSNRTVRGPDISTAGETK